MDLSYTLLGIVVGILVGITGVGGGSLVPPGLTLFGIHPAVAVGTDLAFAGITKTFGTIVHRSRNSVDWRIARLLVFGSCPVAAITIGVLAATESHLKSGLVNMVLAVAVVLTAGGCFYLRPAPLCKSPRGPRKHLQHTAPPSR